MVEAESPRVQELLDTLERDPASLAFVQLAEQYRRAGRYREAITVCRRGLTLHPDYVGARVALGRALADSGALEPAAEEFQRVLAVAPENLAANRALAEVWMQCDRLAEAAERYRVVLALTNGDELVAGILQDLEMRLHAPVGGRTGEGFEPPEAERVQEPDAVEEDAFNPAPVSRRPLPADPERVKHAIAALERWRDALARRRASRGTSER